MNPLLALGSHRFQIAPLNFQRIVRETAVKWPAVARFGGRPSRQMTGYGEDPLTISGLLYPEEFGGREELEALRATQQAARPVIMAGWALTGEAARIFARVVILKIRDEQTSINRDGFGRRLSFEVEVAPVGGGGKPVGLFG